MAWRNVREFGELSMIPQTKLVLIINNLLADLLICQIFFRQMLEMSQFAKIPPPPNYPSIQYWPTETPCIDIEYIFQNWHMYVQINFHFDSQEHIYTYCTF